MRTLSCCDASAKCCSANEALSLSCCDKLQSEIDVLSTSTKTIRSIVDGIVFARYHAVMHQPNVVLLMRR